MNEWTEGRRRLLRGGIAVLGLNAALVGIWATAAPRSFYDDFPGGGHEWVSALGPYNEHLARDVGALYLGLLALAAFAFVTLDRRLVQGTLLAYAVTGLPHLVYHLTTTESFDTADNVASLTGLVVVFALPAALLASTARRKAVVG